MSGILQIISTLNSGVVSGPTPIIPPVTPTVNFDPGTLGRLPTNSDVIGGFPVTIVNTNNQIAYATDFGGIYTKTAGSNYINFGPTYIAGQTYSLFTAYRPGPSNTGRLSCTNSESSGDWVFGTFNGNMNNAFQGGGVINSTTQTNSNSWQMLWLTCNGATSNAFTMYYANGTTGGNYASIATNAGVNAATSIGPRVVHLFNRGSNNNADLYSGDLGIYQVFTGTVLTTTQITSIYNAYKVRFGL
jgi:hypothetical protein